MFYPLTFEEIGFCLQKPPDPDFPDLSPKRAQRSIMPACYLRNPVVPVKNADLHRCLRLMFLSGAAGLNKSKRKSHQSGRVNWPCGGKGCKPRTHQSSDDFCRLTTTASGFLQFHLSCCHDATELQGTNHPALEIDHSRVKLRSVPDLS